MRVVCRRREATTVASSVRSGQGGSSTRAAPRRSPLLAGAARVASSERVAGRQPAAGNRGRLRETAPEVSELVRNSIDSRLKLYYKV